MTLLIALMQDIGPGEGDLERWLIGAMAAALAFLFGLTIRTKDAYANACLDDKKVCTASLSNTTTVMTAMTTEMKNGDQTIHHRQEEILRKLDEIAKNVSDEKALR